MGKSQKAKYVELKVSNLTFNDVLDTGAVCASWKDVVMNMKAMSRKEWEDSISEGELNSLLDTLTKGNRGTAIEWLIEYGFCKRPVKKAKIQTDIDTEYINIYAMDADGEWKELLYTINKKNGKLTVCGMYKRTRDLLKDAGITTMDEDDVMDMADDDRDYSYYPHIRID